MKDIKSELREIFGELRRQAAVLGALLGVMWGLELVDSLLLGQALNQFGIIPRTFVGLRGILFAPFLHNGLAHLAANSAPFLALGWLVLARGMRDFVTVSVIAAFTSGMGAWLFGAPNTIHVGASGVIFGYFGFLLLRGLFDRRLASVLLALLVGAVYGSLLFGVLPLQAGVSWQGHLFGLLGGVYAARLVRPKVG